MRLLKEQGVLQPQLDAKKATVTGYEQAKKELDESTTALNTALENRKQKTWGSGCPGFLVVASVSSGGRKFL
ncbi:hypothetical protein NWH84_004462 [Salmonella enterica]|nr:hypothetical protein [Salmonella enterica subsp. diarizonae serovar 53:r:z35]EJS8541109.1 hypothetical protein [Salmonella enterica]EJS8566963.1 hypothetical protein [Salmonella enterica]EJS8571817.1 hypothetical protein [Salmonella enterica]